MKNLSMTFNASGKSYKLENKNNSRYVRVRHYQELFGLSTPEWQAKEVGGKVVTRGLPEYVSLIGSFVYLTPTLQEFGLQLLKESAGDVTDNARLIKAYFSLMADDICFTNKAGTTSRRCDLTHTNMDKDFMKHYTVVTGGNYLELADPNPVYMFKSWCWKVKAINPKDALPDTKDWKNDKRIIKATVSWAEKQTNGTVNRGVEEFPQLKGRDVPVPVFSYTGYAYIEAWKASLCSADEAFGSVYLPSKNYPK